MAGWDDVSSPVAEPQAGGWDAVSTAVEPPKLPDMSGVQKTAQENLAANDNKGEGEEKPPLTPQEKLDTAAGMPVQSVLNGVAKPSDINVVNRGHYVKALQNGSASNGPDFMQSMLHSVAPIVAGGVQIPEHPLDTAEEAASNIGEALKGGGGLLAYPFLPEAAKQEYIEQNQLTPYQNEESPTPQEVHRRGIELEQGTVGKGMGGLFAPMAVLSPVVSPIIQSTGGEPLKPGELPTWRSNLPGDLGVLMDVAGGFGLVHGALQLRAVRESVASKLNKDPAAVTPQDVDQVIAQGSKDLLPADKDFKAVSTVTGIPEAALHNTFIETGKTPEDVFNEVQKNPESKPAIEAGKAAEVWPDSVEKRELPAEKLSVTPDAASRSFSVVDADGDHVHGGFDSAEEARHYIEDEKFKAEERAAIEEEGQDVFKPEDAEVKPQVAENPYADVEKKVDGMNQQERDMRLESLNKKMEAGIIQPAEMAEREALAAKVKTEKTAAGEQTVIPGAEKISDKELAERKMEGGKRSTKEQKAADEGLFDTGSHKQQDMFASKPKEEIPEPKLPRELSGAKPRYGYGPKQFTLGFESDIDRALYIAQDAKKSKADPRYREFLLKNGFDDEDIAKQGAALKDRIKATAKDAEAGHLLIAAREGAVERIAPQPKPTAKSIIPPSAVGNPTSLRTFLSNNEAKFNENNELVSIKKNGERIKGEAALEYAHEIAKENDYLPKDKPNEPARPVTDLQNALTEKEGREHYRSQDLDRAAKYKDSDEYRRNIEAEAHNAGIETGLNEGESNKQYLKRLTKAVQDFYKSEAGMGITPRAMIGSAITAAEKFAGKLTGGFFEKFADGWIKTFMPELVGPLAKRADAYLAKFKAKGLEAANAFYRADALEEKRFDKMTAEQRKEWRYDHETGRWNEEDDPDHAREQALYDAMHKAESEAIGKETPYKKNYLPHEFEDAEGVEKYFNSEAYIKKYGKDWFTKRSEFELTQDAERAGFKLKTDNPIRMRISRQLASDTMIRTMDLLRDLEGSGVATRATGFGIEKKIAKTDAALKEAEAKYKEAFEKKNPPKQTVTEGTPPATSKLIQLYEKRVADLKGKLDALNDEKAANKLTPDQMKELKGGFRVIGPDSKVWNIHQQAGPVWKNAMEMKGLYENQGAWGSSYRNYMAAKAVYVRTKLMASLFHPTHEVVIDISSSEATIAHHLIQGGKISDLTRLDLPGRIGLTKNTFKFLKGEMPQEHPKIVAWNTAPELRTPEQQAHVDAMNEGGLVPKIPRQDAVNFRDNFDKAISGLGKNNLRLIGTALELPSVPMAPLMEHWIPGMKVDSYFQRRGLALARDPSLLNDAGRRTEVMRGITQDIERNYGEMNRNTQFWNPIVRDAFNAAFFSGGWKLAMLQNFRGLAEPARIAYNYAKTGEFSKGQITHQMLQSYIYTANMLMLGAGLNYLFTGAVGTIKDWVSPQTGDKNPDGTPIRLKQPAFFNEPMMLMHDIHSDGVVAGTGSFLYHTTMIPSVVDTLLMRDFVHRPYITDPTDLQQWKNMGWDTLSPITLTNAERAEQKGSTTAERMGWLGFPIAGSWVNQSPFEQKVMAAYSEHHGTEGSALQAKLKAEMKGAVTSKDYAAQKIIEDKMKAEGMTEKQISTAKKTYTQPFAEHAWKELSAADQKKLIVSASEEEKKRFKVKQ